MRDPIWVVILVFCWYFFLFFCFFFLKIKLYCCLFYGLIHGCIFVLHFLFNNIFLINCLGCIDKHVQISRLVFVLHFFYFFLCFYPVKLIDFCVTIALYFDRIGVFIRTFVVVELFPKHLVCVGRVCGIIIEIQDLYLARIEPIQTNFQVEMLLNTNPTVCYFFRDDP